MIGKLRVLLGVFVGGLFVYAGIVKVNDPAGFFSSIRNYNLLPWQAVAIGLAFYLPWLEIVCGLVMIARPRRLYSGAVLVLFLLTLVFIGALASAKWRGIDLACGCFGAGSPSIGKELGFDLALLACLGFLLSERQRNELR